MRHDFSSDLTKAAPISIAFRRLPHPARHGIGDPAGLVGRQGWVVVYPDWTRVSASPGAAEGGKRCPSAQPLQPDIGRCSFLVHQIAETARVLHPRLALRRSGRQPGTTAPPARLQHRLAGAGRHSVPEAVLPGTLPGVRLEGAFHLELRANPGHPAWQCSLEISPTESHGRGKLGVPKDESYCSDDPGKNSSGCNTCPQRADRWAEQGVPAAGSLPAGGAVARKCPLSRFDTFW
jgi:hypothetical protein